MRSQHIKHDVYFVHKQQFLAVNKAIAARPISRCRRRLTRFLADGEMSGHGCVLRLRGADTTCTHHTNDVPSVN